MFQRLLSTSVLRLSRSAVGNRIRPGPPLAPPAAEHPKTPDSDASFPPDAHLWPTESDSVDLIDDNRQLIIELSRPSGKRRGTVDPFAALFEHLERSRTAWTLNNKWDSDVFTGVCITFAAGTNFEALRKVKGVRSMEHSQLLYLDSSIGDEPGRDREPA